MTKMSRDFKDGTEMRLFLWGLMNNEEWGSEAASYTEQYQFITVVLPLGEGVDARIGASVKDLRATLKFTGDVGESETFSKMAGLRQVFRNEDKKASEIHSCSSATPGTGTGDRPDTGMTVDGDALRDAYGRYMAEPLQSNLKDLYGSDDHTDTGTAADDAELPDSYDHYELSQLHNTGDMYSSFDNCVGGSFHGC